MSAIRPLNLLLDLLSSETLQDVRAEVVHASLGEELFGAERAPEFVFFPHSGSVVSLVRGTEDGLMVEAGVVGDEGLLSVQTIISEPAPIGCMAVVQAAGELTRIPAQRARACFQTDTRFRDGVLTYTSSFLAQVTQNSVCNRLHHIEQRLAKWLLAIRDRVGSDELQLTHDFIAHMLGIHRPGVTIAVQALEVDGLISHARNRIVIRDRAGLLAKACECNAAVHADLESLRASLAY